MVVALLGAPFRSDGSGPPLASRAPWMPDRGDGTYTNPVIFADYSDPDVVRVGDDFYLVASSFGLFTAPVEQPRRADFTDVEWIRFE